MYKVRLFILLLTAVLLSVPAEAQPVIRPEFRINNDSTGGDFSYPSILLTESSKSLIVWDDVREGGRCIYGQLYDVLGDSSGSNFSIGENISSTYNTSPVAEQHGDSVLVVWSESWAQWYHIDGYPLDSAFNLNTQDNYMPRIAIWEGSFYMAFYKYFSGTGYDIIVKRFDFTGDSLSPSIRVNTDTTSSNQMVPDIAIDNDGNFVVVWEDASSGNYEVYGQLFNALCDTIGGNFLINDDGGYSYQYTPSVAMDSAGYFVATWSDRREPGHRDIYAQIFNPDGDTTGFGGNFKVNDDTTDFPKYDPAVDGTPGSEFVIVWEDGRNSNETELYAQLFNSDGDSVGSNFMINEFPGVTEEGYPEVSMNNDYFEVTWLSGEPLHSIFKRRFDHSGSPVEGEKVVNDVHGSYECYNAAIDVNSGGNCVVAWRSERYPSGIYLQRLDADGNKIGTNKLTLQPSQYRPDVSISDNGNFIVVGDRQDVQYQGFYANGDTMYSYRVANDSASWYVSYPSVGMDSSGNAVVAWQDNRDGNYNIYAQYIDTYGDTVGSNFRVNHDTVGADESGASVAMHPSGEFLIAWRDERNGNYDVYGQLFSPSGDTIGGNFKIDDDTTGSNLYEIDTDILPDKRYIVVWRDYRPGYGTYAAVIDSTGSLVGDNIEVNTSIGYSPSVSADTSGKFVVTWFKYNHPTDDVLLQKFNPDYSKDSTYYIVNTEPAWKDLNQVQPDIAVTTDRIFNVWQSPRWKMGIDIVGKVTDWSFASVGEEKIENDKSGILALRPACFTGKTDIKYSVGSKTKVEISIFDVTGRKVRTLVNEKKSPGIYSVTWRGEMDNGGKSPAGVYFTSFRTEETKDVKKLVLLK